MAEISKQALKVENNTEFPNNNAGAITPANLRAFNVDMIDSLVDEISYNVDSASWNNSISRLNTFTSSQQPSFTQLNAFTASQLSVNSGVNTFTQSANGRLNNLEAYTASFTTSVGIYDEGNFVNNVNQIDFNGNGITASFLSGKASVTVDFTKLNSATSSLFTSASLALTTASFDTGTRNLTFRKGDGGTFSVNIPDASGSEAGGFVTTASFQAYTQSNDQRVSSLEANSASVNTSISNLNTSITNVNATTASLLTSVNNLNQSSASQQVSINALNVFTASQSTASIVTSITNLNQFSASTLTSLSNINTFTSSANQRIGSLEAATSSYVTESETASFARTNVDNNFTANQTFTNITAVSASFTYVQTLFETASVIYSSGSNQFGDELTDIQTLSGSVKVQGSLTVNGTAVQTSSFDASALNQATASLQLFTQSANIRLNNLESTTASLNSSISQLNVFSASQLSLNGTFATTGSNNFSGNQTVNGFVSASNGFYSGPNVTALNIGDGSNIRFWSGSTGGTEYYNVQLVPGVGDIAFSRSGAGNVKTFSLAATEGGVTTFQNNPLQIQGNVSSLTINAQSTAISGSGSYTLSAASITQAANTAQLTATSSVIGTFSVTGQSNGDGRAIVLGHSGSLVIGNSANTPTYSALNHISSSQANANTNLIFKTNSNTSDTIISGSANLFTNPAAPTAGFKRYLTGGNIAVGGNGAAIPQISGSMAWSPTIANNLFAVSGTPLTFRGPVSSSASTINNNVLAGGTLNLGTAAASDFGRATAGTSINGNVINATINAFAYKTPLSTTIALTNNNIGGAANINADSSSLGIAGNTIQVASLQINNSYSSSVSAPNNLLQIGPGNGMFGQNILIYASGSNTSATPRGIYGNLISGIFVTASVNLSGDNSALSSTTIAGHALSVTGSATHFVGAPTRNSTHGSAFFGRFNAEDGNRAKTAETVFAVGTGTTSAAKTGFLIDSGSNTFVEGSLNVSGSTSLTGSLTIQSGSSFFANGTKQFNIGAFQSNITQSGSANVSQSMNFETTDYSEGVTIVSNNRITLANAGFYNIQFSAQLLADTGADDVWIWLKKNGTNIQATAGHVVLANNEEVIAAWNYVVQAAANDYFELVWQSTNGDAVLLTEVATGNIPSIPSTILTVTQVR